MDRTFGPFYFHFNHGTKNESMLKLYEDAAQYASPEWNAQFYDSIAKYVPNYRTTAERGTVKVRVQLPEDAKDAIAILSANGLDHQDNVFDTKALQYWADIPNKSGRHSHGYSEVEIPRVAEGTYRLTVYATNIFGDFVKDDIEVPAKRTTTLTVKWKPESHGKELFRIGSPDKSAGEYK